MYVLQSLQGHLSIVQNYNFSLNIPSEFAILMRYGLFPIFLGQAKICFCSKVHCTISLSLSL